MDILRMETFIDELEAASGIQLRPKDLKKDEHENVWKPEFTASESHILRRPVQHKAVLQFSPAVLKHQPTALQLREQKELERRFKQRPGADAPVRRKKDNKLDTSKFNETLRPTETKREIEDVSRSLGSTWKEAVASEYWKPQGDDYWKLRRTMDARRSASCEPHSSASPPTSSRKARTGKALAKTYNCLSSEVNVSEDSPLKSVQTEEDVTAQLSETSQLPASVLEYSFSPVYEVKAANTLPSDPELQGRVWKQVTFPSMEPRTRGDVNNLKQAMDTMLGQLEEKYKQSHSEAASVPVSAFEPVYSVVLSELLRQVTVQCFDRGMLLRRVLTWYMQQPLMELTAPLISDLEAERDRLQGDIFDLRNDLKHTLRQLEIANDRSDNYEKQVSDLETTIKYLRGQVEYSERNLEHERVEKEHMVAFAKQETALRTALQETNDDLLAKSKLSLEKVILLREDIEREISKRIESYEEMQKARKVAGLATQRTTVFVEENKRLRERLKEQQRKLMVQLWRQPGLRLAAADNEKPGSPTAASSKSPSLSGVSAPTITGGKSGSISGNRKMLVIPQVSQQQQQANEQSNATLAGLSKVAAAFRKPASRSIPSTPNTPSVIDGRVSTGGSSLLTADNLDHGPSASGTSPTAAQRTRTGSSTQPALSPTASNPHNNEDAHHQQQHHGHTSSRGSEVASGLTARALNGSPSSSVHNAQGDSQSPLQQASPATTARSSLSTAMPLFEVSEEVVEAEAIGDEFTTQIDKDAMEEITTHLVDENEQMMFNAYLKYADTEKLDLATIISDLRKQINTLQSELRIERDNLEDTQKQLRSMTDQHRTKVAEIDLRQQQLAIRNEELKRVKDKAREAQEAANEESEQLHSELDTLSGKVAQLEDQVAVMSKSLAQANSEVLHLKRNKQAALDDLRAELSAVIDNMEQRHLVDEQTMKAKDKQMARMGQTALEMKAALSEAEQKTLDAFKRVEAHERTLKEMEVKRRGLEGRNKLLETKLAEFGKGLTRQQQEQRIEGLEQSVIVLEDQVKNLKERLKQADAQLLNAQIAEKDALAMRNAQSSQGSEDGSLRDSLASSLRGGALPMPTMPTGSSDDANDLIAALHSELKRKEEDLRNMRAGLGDAKEILDVTKYMEEIQGLRDEQLAAAIKFSQMERGYKQQISELGSKPQTAARAIDTASLAGDMGLDVNDVLSQVFAGASSLDPKTKHKLNKVHLLAPLHLDDQDLRGIEEKRGPPSHRYESAPELYEVDTESGKHPPRAAASRGGFSEGLWRPPIPKPQPEDTETISIANKDGVVQIVIQQGPLGERVPFRVAPNGDRTPIYTDSYGRPIGLRPYRRGEDAPPLPLGSGGDLLPLARDLNGHLMPVPVDKDGNPLEAFVAALPVLKLAPEPARLPQTPEQQGFRPQDRMPASLVTGPGLVTGVGLLEPLPAATTDAAKESLRASLSTPLTHASSKPSTPASLYKTVRDVGIQVMPGRTPYPLGQKLGKGATGARAPHSIPEDDHEQDDNAEPSWLDLEFVPDPSPRHLPSEAGEEAGGAGDEVFLLRIVPQQLKTAKRLNEAWKIMSKRKRGIDPKPLQWVLKMIRSIYDDKTWFDGSQSPESTPLSLCEYVVQWSNERWGLRSLVETFCSELFVSLTKYKEEILEVDTFLMFLENKFTPRELTFFLFCRNIMPRPTTRIALADTNKLNWITMPQAALATQVAFSRMGDEAQQHFLERVEDCCQTAQQNGVTVKRVHDQVFLRLMLSTYREIHRQLQTELVGVFRSAAHSGTPRESERRIGGGPASESLMTVPKVLDTLAAAVPEWNEQREAVCLRRLGVRAHLPGARVDLRTFLTLAENVDVCGLHQMSTSFSFNNADTQQAVSELRTLFNIVASHGTDFDPTFIKGMMNKLEKAFRFTLN